MTIEAKRAGRIDVWPDDATAIAADTDVSKRFGRMTIWPTSSAARSHTTYDAGGGGGGGGVDWQINFAAGTYTYNGTTVSLTDIFISDPDYGTDFSPSNVTNGSGYAGSIGGLNASGQLLTDLLAGATTVFTIGPSSDGILNDLLFEAYDGGEFIYDVLVRATQGGVWWNNNINSGAEDADLLLEEDNIVAITLTSTHRAVSVNGSAVVSSSVDSGDWSHIARFAIYLQHTQWLRAMQVMLPQDDAALPALSTPV